MFILFLLLLLPLLSSSFFFPSFHVPALARVRSELASDRSRVISSVAYANTCVAKRNPRPIVSAWHNQCYALLSGRCSTCMGASPGTRPSSHFPGDPAPHLSFATAAAYELPPAAALFGRASVFSFPSRFVQTCLSSL